MSKESRRVQTTSAPRAVNPEIAIAASVDVLPVAREYERSHETALRCVGARPEPGEHDGLHRPGSDERRAAQRERERNAEHRRGHAVEQQRDLATRLPRSP